ncbi:MAG: glycosyltransferase [Polyangiaceae bacterium]|nr:glycosyltransferase [Polyangiaceae bacterium]
MVAIFFLCCGLIALVSLSSAYMTVLWRKLTRSAFSSQTYPPLTILKPLKGADDGLRENLLAILQQDHPGYEVIFASADPEDPGLQVAKELAAFAKNCSVQYLTGDWGSGLNPKVRLLRRMVQAASHEWILISDSNVRPERNYLASMQIVQQRTGAELVHSLLSAAPGRTIGARLEELHLNSWVAASICLSQGLGHPCVIGKSMLMRRSTLQLAGGLASVQDILAEDYILGSRIRKLGHQVALCADPLTVTTGQCSLQHFLNRHVRWGQMRRRISPFFFLAELIANPTPFFLTALLLGSQDIQCLAASGLAVKWLADIGVYLFLGREPQVETLLLIPLKDLLVPLMWATSALRQTVNWRGNKMLIGPGSQLLPLRPSESESLDGVFSHSPTA